MKGNQVAPAELESILLEHPAVADAAVIGITKYEVTKLEICGFYADSQKGRRRISPSLYCAQARQASNA